MLKRFLMIIVILAVLGILLYQPIRGIIFESVVNSIYKESEVPTIKPSQIDQPENYVWLDSRSKREYEISHIKNARWIGYEEFDLAKLNDIAKDDPIIIYCSIGYRSQVIGEKLHNAGFSNVQNLYGGIFKWLNDGYPIYGDGKMTNKIHPYSRKWGMLLNKGEKTY